MRREEGTHASEPDRQRGRHGADVQGQDLHDGDPDHCAIAEVKEQNVDHKDKHWQPA